MDIRDEALTENIGQIQIANTSIIIKALPWLAAMGMCVALAWNWGL